MRVIRQPGNDGRWIIVEGDGLSVDGLSYPSKEGTLKDALAAVNTDIRKTAKELARVTAENERLMAELLRFNAKK